VFLRNRFRCQSDHFPSSQLAFEMHALGAGRPLRRKM
jgi:hypothetical protein